MKNLILTTSFIVATLFAFGQNNLEFNTALFQEFTANTAGYASNPITLGTITVPAGKVWKIEWVNKTMITDCGVGQSFHRTTTGLILLNNAIFGTGDGVIWLPEGTYDVVLSGSQDSCVQSYSTDWFITYSGIEFNVVQ